MAKVLIKYNPYIVKTEVTINGKKIDERKSHLNYVIDKRLQEWIEPKEGWNGIYRELKECIGDSRLSLDFIGTFSDFEDLAYAKDKYGECFEHIDLIHKNKARAGQIDPSKKMDKLKKLYEKLQNGPVEELKSPDIQKNFDSAVNSEFRIIIVAPMSSGKSTLINSIIGRDLLPAINQATTAVITEIKDNDSFEDFLVNADDKYGNNLARNEKATKKLITELNNKKDPNDKTGKEALVHSIKLEGPIANLPSNVLNTVFVDTPGGNNSQNKEHEDMMDEAINDENKSLILYVFNGAQLGTNDSNIILQKIANAMQNSINGKQSRDRFLFVANRMDEFDISEEPYESVIENTILPQLAANGITEPNLFLASAQATKLVRIAQDGGEMSETEEEDLERFVKRFTRTSRILPKYDTSLNSVDKDKIMSELDNCREKAENTDSKRVEKENKYRIAEISSGVPAIEMAIREYLEKYAIAIKIKTVHDAFMKKVNERNMMDNCQMEWSKSKESFDEIKNELKEKKKNFNNSKKLKEFRERVYGISLNTKPIKVEQAKITKELDTLAEIYKEKVSRVEAEVALRNFETHLENIGRSSSLKLNSILNNGVKKTCYNVLLKYEEYIRELDSDGVLNVGRFNMKATSEFDRFNITNVDELLNNSKYLEKRNEKVGEHYEKKEGLAGILARINGSIQGVFNPNFKNNPKSKRGYELVEEYEEREYIDLKKLINDQMTPIKHAFDKEINNMIDETENQVEQMKTNTINILKDLDETIKNLTNEIDKMLVSRKELDQRVKANKEKSEWLKEFIDEVDKLLEI